jgi:hypothetical protein
MQQHDDVNEFCRRVCSQVRYHRVHERITKELSDHIMESAEHLCHIYPISEEEARQEAINRMGNPEELGKKLNREHAIIYYWTKRAVKILFVVAVILICLYLFQMARGYLQNQVANNSSDDTAKYLWESVLPDHFSGNYLC